MAEMTLLCEILRDGAKQNNAEQDNAAERYFCTLKRNGKIKGEWLESCFLDDVSLEREANSTAPQTRQALKATERHSAYSGLPRPFWPDKVEFIGQTVLDATIPQVFRRFLGGELSMTPFVPSPGGGSLRHAPRVTRKGEAEATGRSLTQAAA
jgi:hypothetical protein